MPAQSHLTNAAFVPLKSICFHSDGLIATAVALIRMSASDGFGNGRSLTMLCIFSALDLNGFSAKTRGIQDICRIVFHDDGSECVFGARGLFKHVLNSISKNRNRNSDGLRSQDAIRKATAVMHPMLRLGFFVTPSPCGIFLIGIRLAMRCSTLLCAQYSSVPFRIIRINEEKIINY